MPLYEYECSSCGGVSEMLMKISDPSPTTCPLCNKEGSLRKLVSQSCFVLKGNGWYETDFKKKPTKKPTEESPSASNDTSSASAAAPAAATSAG